MYAAVGSLSVNLHNVLVGLPRQGGTGVHLDCMYTGQDNIYVVPVVAGRLMFITLAIMLRLRRYDAQDDARTRCYNHHGATKRGRMIAGSGVATISQ